MENIESSPQQPTSFERVLTTEEERDVLINFMGNIYGETKKLDSNVIGASSTLSNNKSNEIRQHIEKLVHTTREEIIPAIPVSSAASIPVTVAASIPVDAATALMNVVEYNQLSFNFDIDEKAELFALVNKILTRLDRLHHKVDKIAEQIECSQPQKKKSAN